MKGTKKRGLNLQQEKLWNHLSNYMLKKAGHNHPTPLRLVIRSKLKKLHFKAGQKLSRHVFYSFSPLK